MYNPFICCWMRLGSILLRIFTSIRKLFFNFFLIMSLALPLGYFWPHRMCYEVFPLFLFWEEFENRCKFFCRHVEESNREAIQSWAFLCCNFLTTDSISLLFTGLFRISISSRISFGCQELIHFIQLPNLLACLQYSPISSLFL